MYDDFRPGKPLQTLFENSVEDSEVKVGGIHGHNLTAEVAKLAKKTTSETTSAFSVLCEPLLLCGKKSDSR